MHHSSILTPEIAKICHQCGNIQQSPLIGTCHWR